MYVSVYKVKAIVTPIWMRILNTLFLTI